MTIRLQPRLHRRASLLTSLILAGCGGTNGGGDISDVQSAVTVVTSASAGPLMPAPSPTPTPMMAMTIPLGNSVLTASLGGAAQVASGLTVAKLLGPKRVPGSAAPDVVGAFRFLCGPGQLLPDDPIVYPGQPGKAHLHQFFGNLGANANSTYASLRSSGDSTCMNELNRSAYWMPAMLDGRGNAVRPDNVAIYYKRRPKTDAVCRTAAQECVEIPRGLRLVFGWDQMRPREAQPDNAAKFNFKCVVNGHPTTAAFPNMVMPLKACRAGQQLIGAISTPLCWNGRELDSPDHRSHVADMIRDRTTNYQSQCPRTHPKLLPQFTMGVTWTIGAGDDPTRWTLASDPMKPGGLPGETFHSDYFEAWEEAVRIRWHAGCIDHLLNCSDGDLGDGQIMMRGKYYPSKAASPRLVRVPTS